MLSKVQETVSLYSISVAPQHFSNEWPHVHRSTLKDPSIWESYGMSRDSSRRKLLSELLSVSKLTGDRGTWKNKKAFFDVCTLLELFFLKKCEMIARKVAHIHPNYVVNEVFHLLPETCSFLNGMCTLVYLQEHVLMVYRVKIYTSNTAKEEFMGPNLYYTWSWKETNSWQKKTLLGEVRDDPVKGLKKRFLKSHWFPEATWRL